MFDWRLIVKPLLQTPQPPGMPASPSFWDANRDTILVAVITAVVILLLSRPLNAALDKFGAWIGQVIQSFGFGFRKRYYRHLCSQHEWLKLIGVRKAALERPRLGDIYISLRLNAALAEHSPALTWHQIFSGDHKQLLILGQPGAGKSTLLDYLVLIFIGQVNHPLIKQLGLSVPLFARLRDIGLPGKPSSLLKLLEIPENMQNVPKGYFECLLRRGRCVVLLDGLDEVLDQAMHDRVVSQIQALASEYPNNWFVVTCRVAGWRNQLPGFRAYEIQEFDQDDVRHFIGAWYREVLRAQSLNELGPNAKPANRQQVVRESDRRAIDQANNLWDVLRKNESLLRIARTPLILSLITLVHYAQQTQLPKGRARLYARCLEILLEEWDLEDKRLAIQNSPTLKDKLMILKAVAFQLLRENLLDLDDQNLEALVEPLLSNLSIPSDAKSLIQNIYQRSGVLVEQAIGRYGFAHRALQDFLSASYLVDEGLDD